MGIFHTPVLLQSVCSYLDIKKNGSYIDATYGGGGHSEAIIKLGGKVLGIDQDIEALTNSPEAKVSSPALTLAKGNFMFLEEIAKKNGFYPVDGILFDLGVSSHQINNPRRGFSYQTDGPLDMRMDLESKITASNLVNELDEKQLVLIFKKFGELSNAKVITTKILANRPILSTKELSGLFPDFSQKQLVFQALRIAVNGELTAIEAGLDQSISLLKPAGRIVVISFHSLEDRLIKKTFNEWEKSNFGQVLTKNPVIPDQKEILSNSRSKSSKLRCFKKYV